MKIQKQKKILTIIIIICFKFNLLPVFAESSESRTEQEQNEKTLYTAVLGGLFVNVAFNLGGRVFGADFAQVTLDSMKANLNSEWYWDNDFYILNHPGHPYQGGLYHAAARASGFSFYESVFFTGLGSLTWELFGETDTPSINDLISTSFGGPVFGEMMHLLYLETNSVILGILISPMDSITNAVIKKKPERTNNLYHLSYKTGASWVRAIIDDRAAFEDDDISGLNHIFTANIGVDVTYGDPFIQHSKKPYSHFELKMLIGGSLYALWYDWTILSDGYLRSFNLLDNEKDILSTGLTLHYDLAAGSNLNFASNALAWSVKWKREFTSSFLEFKPHLGWTFLGSSHFYPFAEMTESNLILHDPVNNYGTGIFTKIFLTYQSQRFGRIALSICDYLLYMINFDDRASNYIESLSIFNLEYSYPITEKISIVTSNSLYVKNGRSFSESNIVTVSFHTFFGIITYAR